MSIQPSRRIRTATVATSLLLFVACLPLPAIRFRGVPIEWAYEFFLMGWAGPAAGHFEWFANPLLLVGMHRFWRGRSLPAMQMALGAIVLIIATWDRGCIVKDEGGFCAPIVDFLIGWWLWLASAIVLFSVSGTFYLRDLVARWQAWRANRSP